MKQEKPIRCDKCGKFIAYTELDKDGGASSVFIPDSEVSVEELRWRCKKCTTEKGAVKSYQFPNAGDGYQKVH